MVTYKVVVTPMAQNSLRTISDRIKEEASAKVAAKVRRAIGETIKSLARLSTYSSYDCPDDGLPKDNPIINSFHS
jgi:plasmid stabilization system protein ParE